MPLQVPCSLRFIWSRHTFLRAWLSSASRSFKLAVTTVSRFWTNFEKAELSRFLIDVVELIQLAFSWIWRSSSSLYLAPSRVSLKCLGVASSCDLNPVHTWLRIMSRSASLRVRLCLIWSSRANFNWLFLSCFARKFVKLYNFPFSTIWFRLCISLSDSNFAWKRFFSYLSSASCIAFSSARGGARRV